MMKKTIAFALLISVLLGTMAVVSAESALEYKNIKISVNGEKVILLNAEDEQQKSISSDGVIYVPIESFITAIGGEYAYDEENNQITISLSSGNGSTEGQDSSAESDYSDEDIASLLLSGRWTMEQEQGITFLDFKEDHTGLISTLVAFTWTVNNKIVSLDYTSQGKDHHMDLAFSVTGGTSQLTREDGNAFVLGESSNPMMNLTGEWHLRGDESSQLFLKMDANFELKLNGLTYKGTWAYSDNGSLIMTQNGISITGKYNGTSLSLNINGKNFTFVR